LGGALRCLADSEAPPKKKRGEKRYQTAQGVRGYSFVEKAVNMERVDGMSRGGEGDELAIFPIAVFDLVSLLAPCIK
jgi:hypothetical protein